MIAIAFKTPANSASSPLRWDLFLKIRSAMLVAAARGENADVKERKKEGGVLFSGERKEPKEVGVTPGRDGSHDVGCGRKDQYDVAFLPFPISSRH